ncbi:MAG: hypothetical protein DMG01_22970 [Acidobacteria bacterium]|nr:MAG: hypothetical protein DMG01_22970 [Acidobacteriota bacterium]
MTACGLQAAPAGPVTFARDVAPIVFERCAVCHRPNGSAPFSLLTYATARPHATQIAAVTRTRVMPPWKSEPGYGDFIGHRPLTDGEIRVLQRWLEDGAAEGDAADLPTPPQWTDGWQLGIPDLVVALAQPYVLAEEGTDVSRVFVLPIPIESMRYVRGVEFRPGNAKVVHLPRACSTNRIQLRGTTDCSRTRPSTPTVIFSAGRRARSLRCSRRAWRGASLRAPTSSSKCT